VKGDETARAAWRFQDETLCVPSFERSFMRPTFPGDEALATLSD